MATYRHFNTSISAVSLLSSSIISTSNSPDHALSRKRQVKSSVKVVTSQKQLNHLNEEGLVLIIVEKEPAGQ